MSLSKISNLIINNKKNCSILKSNRVNFIFKDNLPFKKKLQLKIKKISYLLSTAILLSKNNKKLTKFLENKIINNPNDWSNFFKLGILMFYQDNLPQALNYFKVSCSLKKDFALGRYWLGRVYELLENETDALAQYKSASELEPTDWRSWTKRAEHLITKGMYDSAQKCLKTALSINGRNGDLQALSAYLAYTLNNKNDFINAYLKALKLGVEDINLNLNLSCCLIKVNKYKEALRFIEMGLKIEPDNFILLNNKGYSLSMLNNHSEAVQTYIKAHNLNPIDVEIINNIGTSYLNLNSIHEAIKWYDLGLKILPNPTMLNNKAVCLEWLGRFDEATSLYRKAANLDPRNPIYKKNYRLNLINAHKYEVVISNCLKLFQENKELNVDTYEELGYCLYQLKKYNDALRMFNAGLTIKPDNPVFLARIGLCLDKLNRKEEALSYYQAVLEINKNKKVI